MRKTDHAGGSVGRIQEHIQDVQTGRISQGCGQRLFELFRVRMMRPIRGDATRQAASGGGT
jgi:hypothetical protein